MDSQTVSYLPMILFLILFFFFFRFYILVYDSFFWVNLCILCKVWSVVVAVLFTQRYSRFLGFPGDSSGKEASCRCRRCGFDPWVRKISWRRTWQHTPVCLLGKFHAQRSLAVHGGAKSQTQLSMCVCLCTHIHARAHVHTHTHIQVFQHHLLFHIACGILVLWPGLKSVSPASEGRVLSIQPPGKSMTHECI